MHFIGDLDGIAIGLAINVKQYSRLAVRRHNGIHRLNVRSYCRNVADPHRDARGRSLNDSIGDLFGRTDLAVD